MGSKYQLKHRDGHFVPHDEDRWHDFVIKLSGDFKDAVFYAPGIGGNGQGDPCYKINIDSEKIVPDLVDKLPHEMDGVEIVYEFKKRGQVRLLPLLITPDVK